MIKLPIIRKSYTLIDGPLSQWFACEDIPDCGERRIRVHLGSPLGFAFHRTVSGAAWELLLSTSALDFSETPEEFKRAISCAKKTAGSRHPSTSDFQRRMEGLTPRPMGSHGGGWNVIKWVSV